MLVGSLHDSVGVGMPALRLQSEAVNNFPSKHKPKHKGQKVNINTINASQFKDTAFLRISLNRYGNRAKVKNDGNLQEYLAILHAPDGEAVAFKAVESNGGSKAVNTTKVLIRSKPLDELNQFLTETKDSLVGKYGKANPSRVMDGLFIVALPLVTEFDDKLIAARKKLTEELLPAAVADYPLAIERARTEPVKQGGLGPLFNPSDYAPVEQFSAQFGIKAQWLSLNVAEDLPPEIKLRAQEEFQQQMKDAAEEVKDALRLGFQELISHAVERLTPSEDGKQKVFRGSLITNVQQFLDVFADRNIMKDGELEKLVGKAQEVLIGIDVNALRKEQSARDMARAKFAEINAALEPMIVVKKNRRFSLDEE